MKIAFLTFARQIELDFKILRRPLYLGKKREPTLKERTMSGERVVCIDLRALLKDAPKDRRPRLFQTWRTPDYVLGAPRRDQ